MAKDWSAQLDSVDFRCSACRYAWAAAPDLIEDEPDDEFHPHRYFANCPRCGAEHQSQAAWARNLMRAHQKATGPKTSEGQAKVGQNLEGHPNSEAQRRTRFNAMKHGMAAKTATYFPAKPDGYSFCAQCDVSRTWCEGQAACVKQTEIFMLHHAAFESRNPRVLAGVHADLQAGLTAMLQMLMQGVLADGVTLKVPKVELDREGNCVTLSYQDEIGNRHNVYELSAHPALKSITDFVNRLGLSMNDLAMTPRTAESEDEGAGGTLKLDAKTQETLQGFGQRMELAMGTARELLTKAHKATSEDPVLVAHEARTGKT